MDEPMPQNLQAQQKRLVTLEEIDFALYSGLPPRPLVLLSPAW